MHIKSINEFNNTYNEHVKNVQYFIDKLIKVLELSDEDAAKMKSRAFTHDKSKIYNYDEFKGYILMKSELEGLEYQSKEYKDVMEKYKYVIDLHYKNNDHHPEHFKNGIADMNKFQVYEMICDWLGAMKTYNNTSGLAESLIKNKVKFNIQNDDFDTISEIATKLMDEE